MERQEDELIDEMEGVVASSFRLPNVGGIPSSGLLTRRRDHRRCACRFHFCQASGVMSIHRVGRPARRQGGRDEEVSVLRRGSPR
jgi:hypothetical protein